MANNNKDKGRLQKIGLEAFKILEEEYGTKRRPYAPQKGKAAAWPAMPRQPEPPKQGRHYKPQQPTEEMIDSYEAMKLHDGLVIMDYSKSKAPAAMAY